MQVLPISETLDTLEETQQAVKAPEGFLNFNGSRIAASGMQSGACEVAVENRAVADKAGPLSV